MRQPPPPWGARSWFVGAGMRKAASAALCWPSPAVLGSPGARCSSLQMVPGSLGTTPSDLGTMPSPACTTGGCSSRPVLANCPRITVPPSLPARAWLSEASSRGLISARCLHTPVLQHQQQSQSKPQIWPGKRQCSRQRDCRTTQAQLHRDLRLLRVSHGESATFGG